MKVIITTDEGEVLDTVQMDDRLVTETQTLMAAVANARDLASEADAAIFTECIKLRARVAAERAAYEEACAAKTEAHVTAALNKLDAIREGEVTP